MQVLARQCNPRTALQQQTRSNSILSSLFWINPWPRESSTARAAASAQRTGLYRRHHPYQGLCETAPHRPPRKIPAVQRYETKPGYQAQVDWKICEYIDLDGNVRKIPVFATVLGYSRMGTSSLPNAATFTASCAA
jgi:transposase